MVTDNRIPVVVYLSKVQYRAMASIAVSKTTDPDRPVQVHHLLEHLTTALLARTIIPEQPVKVKRPSRARKGTDVARLKELHAGGANDSQIAAELGIDRSTVRQYREKFHLPANAKGGRPRTMTPPEPTKENHYS